MGATKFSWFANQEHYQANPPQDHTPYSSDAWPQPDPEWVVFATDIMVDAVHGKDEAQRIFDHLLASAKNGSAPWIKYLIWEATIYDVRHNWAPQPNSGHFDHIHVSARTDHQFTHLGDWSVMPQEDEMTPDQAAQLQDNTAILTALASGADTARVHDKDGVLDLRPFYTRIAAEVVHKLPADSGGGVNAEQVTTIVRQQLDKTRLAEGA
jgi:hypothetical protein